MKQTENKIKRAFTNITPDILETVVSDSAIQKGTVMYVKQKRRLPVVLVAVAAAFVMLFGVFAGVLAYMGNNAVASVVSIDVNPSIEIKLNRKDVVVDIKALNEDGQKIIGNMDLTGTKIEVALNALIGSMITGGYIDELANSVLVSVDNGNADKNAALREKLNAIISGLITTENAEGAVIALQIDKNDTDSASLADKLGISLGKAQLILSLCANNAKYDPESLAKLGINELSLLLQEIGAELKGEFVGSASDKAYIGVEKAKAAALEYAKVSKDLVEGNIKAEFEHDDGMMVYEVEFHAEGVRYEIEVNAVTGNIISCEKKNRDVVIGGAVGEYVSAKEVEDIISAYCPERQEWQGFEYRFQYDDGVLICEAEVSYKGVEYEFEVNAKTGEVISVESDRYYHYEDNSSGNSEENGLITKEQALKKVLDRAGLAEDDISRLNIELDHDDNVWKYEIEFISGRYEYEAEINADTGEIISYERDTDD